MTISTRKGLLKIKQISCGDVFSCNFDIQIEAIMVPEFSVMVYKVINKQLIYQGKANIETENLGRNFVSLIKF